MNKGARATTARLAAEFVVIVIGVLTALAVDQVMEQRRERELERELLLGFVENLRTDSIDYFRLPMMANQRAYSAELLLRNLAPGSEPGARVAPNLEALGPYDVPASDEALARAWRLVDLPTDLDVARGSYTEFAEGGAQRLVRNPELRRAIHDYYYQVELNQKFDPWVTSGLEELATRSIDVGLAPAEPDVARIRAGFERGGDVLASALRQLQAQSVVQADIGVFLAGEAQALMDALRAEISPR
jgi:hypothetical protein